MSEIFKCDRVEYSTAVISKKIKDCRNKQSLTKLDMPTDPGQAQRGGRPNKQVWTEGKT